MHDFGGLGADGIPCAARFLSWMSATPSARRWPRTLPSSSGCIQKHSGGTEMSPELQVPCNVCGSPPGRWACGVGRTTMDAPFSSSSISSEGRGQLFLSTTSRLWKPVFKSLPFLAMRHSETDALPWSLSRRQMGLLSHLLIVEATALPC